MSHHNLPITYRPKADAVFAGTCDQSMRKGNKYAVGDALLIFEWTGKPYRSRWGRRLRAVVTETESVWLYHDGFVFPCHGTRPSHWQGTTWWQEDAANQLAIEDGIVPPTGVALRATLMKLNGKDWQGEYQIVHWRPQAKGGGKCS